MDVRTATKKELLALPTLEREQDCGWWDALLIVPSRKKHDSGWACIAIIGLNFGTGVDEATHILAWPDDIQWPAHSSTHTSGPLRDYGALRTDAYYRSGVMRLWSRSFQFSVDYPTSSVEILIRPKA